MALWQFALAGYPAHFLGVAAGAYSSCSSPCPWWMLGVTGFLGTAKPPPSQGAQDTDWDVNYSQPIHQKDAVPVHAWDWPVPSHGEPPRKGGCLEENSQQIFSHRELQSTKFSPAKKVRNCPQSPSFPRCSRKTWVVSGCSGLCSFGNSFPTRAQWRPYGRGKQDIPLVKLKWQEPTPSKGHKKKFHQLEVSFQK